jgi:hypothetical protein
LSPGAIPLFLRIAMANAAPPVTARPITARIVAEVLVVAAGLAAFAGAFALDLAWLERRFGLERPELVWRERALLIAVGIALTLFARPRVGRWAERVGAAEAVGACFRIGVSVVLAFVASEVGLRALKLPWRTGVATDCLAEPNARYGWLFKASRSFTIQEGGRPIHRDFDADHNRAKSVDFVPDPKRPTIFFVGESIAAGHGLEWEETLPALVGEALNLQVVNLGVEGFAADQGFLRLRDTLPRFERPVAVVTLFLPLMVGRIQRVDHQRLVFAGDEPTLVSPGFVQGLRLTQVFRELSNFQAEWAIETTAEVFRQTERLARERRARAIFVTPYVQDGWPRRDGYLIEELLVRQGLTVVDPRFGFERISGEDSHPNAASTRRLAEAVVGALRAELAAR